MDAPMHYETFKLSHEPMDQRGCPRFASVLWIWTLTWELLTPPLFFDPARQHRYDIKNPVSYSRMAARHSLFDNLDGRWTRTLPSQNGNASRDFERLSPYSVIFYV